jgi:hypothetical protein
VKPSSAKAKGTRLEHHVASVTGGKRTPLSGSAGGGDITHPTGTIWHDWSWECKQRKTLPALITGAMAQAQFDIPLGDRRKPAVVIREDRGRALFVAYLDDVVPWAEALAETGQGVKVRQLAKQLLGIAEELRGIS